MKTFYRLLLSAAAVVAASAEARIFPKTVAELDLGQYLGTWYEIASTKPSFQRDCVCVTADYNLRDDGKVQVLNSCRKNSVDAAPEVAEGTASTSRSPGKFTVSFGGFNFPFTNYWVVDLADDYSYAVVSTPFRTPIWILSRTPELPAETLDGIYSRLRKAHFPVKTITSTLQAGCPS